MLTAILCSCLPIYKPLWVSTSRKLEEKLRKYVRWMRKGVGKDSPESDETALVRMDTLDNVRIQKPQNTYCIQKPVRQGEAYLNA